VRKIIVSSTISTARFVIRDTLVCVLVIAAAFNGAAAQEQSPPAVVLAAGDIADCQKSVFSRFLYNVLGINFDSGAPATASVLKRLPATILALGDLAYPDGSKADFHGCYDRTWGRYKDRTKPVPGNHEYRSLDAEPYFAYWGERAGKPRRGYYSFDVGAWHLIALDSNIEATRNSVQGRWLRRDLLKTRTRCILAYWHHPIQSSGRVGDSPRLIPLLRILYKHGASIVLAGHAHSYERFAPQDPDGLLNRETGIRQFVVGTGGATLRPMIQRHKTSEVFYSDGWGLLKLTLHDDRYAWEFIATDKTEFQDSGTAPCVRRPPLAGADHGG
jgi:acid phosphatase type 7